MQENAVDVYIRHRNELLKAIFDNTSPEQEVGDYLLSVRNLQHHDIQFEKNNADIICDSYSNYILTKESVREWSAPGTKTITSQSGKVKSEYRPAMMQSYGTDHDWLGRFRHVKQPRHPLASSMSMMHSMWPEIHPENEDGSRAESYVTRHPYHKKTHPLRLQNGITGKPEWENILRDFYFSNDSEESFAEQLMAMEDAHESHHSKQGSEIYHGISKGGLSHGLERAQTELDKHQGEEPEVYDKHLTNWEGEKGTKMTWGQKLEELEGNVASKTSLSDKSYPFFGGSKGHESDTKHQHSLRLRDFERWKKEQGDERLGELEEEGVSEKDLEKMHFDDRMQKLMSDDTLTEHIDPTKHLPEDKVYQIIADGQGESLEPYKEQHGHGMGWATYMMGMEFLTPQERSTVMEHLDSHGTDDAEEQSIKLDDNHRIPISRIKKNMEMRMSPEIEWWNRDSPHAGANKAKHVESGDDTKSQGDKGIIASILRKTHMDASGDPISHGMEKKVHEVDDLSDRKEAEKEGRPMKKKMVAKTAHDILTENIEDLFEGEGDLSVGNSTMHYSGKRKNLFPFSKRDIEGYQAAMQKGESLEDAIKSKISDNSDGLLTKAGLLSLTGYDEGLNRVHEEGEHPVFDAWHEPLLTKETMRSVMKQYGNLSGLAKNEKTIRNGYGAARRGLNGPNWADLSSAEKAHYYSVGGKARGWAYPFSKPFTHRGGLGRQQMTQIDFLHNHLSPDEGETSMLGQIGDQLGDMIPNPDTIGAFGGLHHHVLPVNQFSHISPLGIISRSDTTAHSQGSVKTKRGLGRNAKNNSSDYDFTRSPALAAILEYGNPSEDDYKMKRKITRGLDRQGFAEGNPFSRIGTMKTGDVGIRDSAGLSHMYATALGRDHPWSIANPSPKRVYSYDDMLARRDIHSSQGEGGPEEFIRHLPTSAKSTYKEDREPVFDNETGEQAKDKFGRLKWKYTESEETGGKPGEMEKLLFMQDELDNLMRNKDKFSGDSETMEKFNANLKMLTGRIKGLQSQETERALPQTLHRDDPSKQRKDIDDIMNEDSMAVQRYAKEVLLPLILKENPNAFNTDNPNQAMHNAMRLMHDAARGLYHDGDHKISTVGHITGESEVKTTSNPHWVMASALGSKDEEGRNTFGMEIGPETKIEKIIQGLGLPNDEAHKEHVKRYKASIGGTRVQAMSVGQLASSGFAWNENAPDMFEGLQGIPSMSNHLSEKIGNAMKNRPAYRSRRERNDYWNNHFSSGAYSGVNWLHTLLGAQGGNNSEIMKNYALSHFTPPARKVSTKKNRQKHLEPKVKGQSLLHTSGLPNYAQRHDSRMDMGSGIVSFDSQAVPEGGLPTGSKKIMKPTIDFGTGRIRPLDEMDGLVPHDHYASGTMDWGPEVSPNIGVEYPDGSPVVGTKFTDTQYLNRVSGPVLRGVFGSDWAESVLGGYDTTLDKNPNSPQMTPGPSGFLASEDFTNVAKGELPKKVPLIEPLHRVFDLDDIKELRGFTGEWVVSVYREGKRCKVTKKGNRVRLVDDNNVLLSTDDSVRSALKSACKKDYVIDGVLDGDEFYINDILYYDDTEVTDLTTRERIKILRGQFDSYDPVFVPSPSDIRITDEVGLESAVKELSKESDKILLRDAKSTYMKGEERHPKWVLLAKSDVSYHIPFSMEMDGGYFIIHLPEDLVKYEIVEEKAVNPIAAIGQITESDYSLRLAESLEPYWEEGFSQLLKEDGDVAGADIEPEIDEERIEEESAGILKPKKDKNLIMKPKNFFKALLLIEQALDKMEKGVSNLSGRGLGIDVGGGVESPRGPTKLDAEQALPDWDMKKRPTEDSEKPEDYPGREKKKRHTTSQSNDSEEEMAEI